MQSFLPFATIPPLGLMVAAATSLAGESPSTPAGGRAAVPDASWLVGLLVTILLGLAGYLVLAARRR